MVGVPNADQALHFDIKSVMPDDHLSKPSNSYILCDVVISKDGENGKETYGTGLKNEGGEYNCFLNVIIQVGIRTPYSLLFYYISC